MNLRRMDLRAAIKLNPTTDGFISIRNLFSGINEERDGFGVSELEQGPNLTELLFVRSQRMSRDLKHSIRCFILVFIEKISKIGHTS